MELKNCSELETGRKFLQHFGQSPITKINYLDHVQPIVAIKATLTVFQYSDIPFIVNIHSTEGLQTCLYCTLLRTEYKGCASPKPTKNHLPKSTKKRQ